MKIKIRKLLFSCFTPSPPLLQGFCHLQAFLWVPEKLHRTSSDLIFHPSFSWTNLLQSHSFFTCSIPSPRLLILPFPLQGYSIPGKMIVLRVEIWRSETRYFPKTLQISIPSIHVISQLCFIFLLIQNYILIFYNTFFYYYNGECYIIDSKKVFAEITCESCLHLQTSKRQ